MDRSRAQHQSDRQQQRRCSPAKPGNQKRCADRAALDYGGDVGGYLKKDKIWFYGGARARENDNFVLDCAKPDGTQCDTTLGQKFYSGRVTYQINNSNKLIGYYQRNLKDNVTGAGRSSPGNRGSPSTSTAIRARVNGRRRSARMSSSTPWSVIGFSFHGSMAIPTTPRTSTW